LKQLAWNKTTEIIEKYVTRGNEIMVEGKLTSRSYETKGSREQVYHRSCL